MPSGPLPKPPAERVRRNQPTIPTTKLPAAGFAGPAPKCPVKLSRAGKAWWRWAWRTPQAAAWSDGDLYVIARRAQLEDDLDAARAEGVPIGSLSKAATELEDRLGLTPKAMAALRWSIVAEETAEKASTTERRRLQAV